MLEAHDLSGEEEEHLDGHGRDDDDGGDLIGDGESDNLVMIKVIIMEIVRDNKSEIDGCPLSLSVRCLTNPTLIPPLLLLPE